MMMFDENIHTYIVVFCLNIKKNKQKLKFSTTHAQIYVGFYKNIVTVESSVL